MQLIRLAMGRILIVGSGLTGSATSLILSESLPKTWEITTWEKAKGTGGRISVVRHPRDHSSTIDIGAQYITATPDSLRLHARFYDSLLSAGILRPIHGLIANAPKYPEGSQHFMGPSGLNSLVKHFLSRAGTVQKFDHDIKNISISNENPNNYMVKTVGGHKQAFDIVILTQPVPQILQLEGDISIMIDKQFELKQKLEKVTYSSRYALAMFFEKGTTIDVPWCAKYFDNDPCIRFVSVDSKKREADSSITPSLLVHTSVDYGLKHLEDNISKVQDTITSHLLKLLPQLPAPTLVKCHRWRYSQVYEGMEDKSGCLVLQNQPLLVCGGDAFTAKSNFDGCLESALKISQAVKIYLSH